MMHLPTVPKEGEQLVHSGLARILARGVAAPAAFRNIDIRSVKIQDGHAVYDLGLDAVRPGASLDSARRSAIRYLVSDRSKPVAAAEVLVDGNQRATLLANVNSGPFVASFAQALSDLAHRAEVVSGTFEARLLRVSAIAVVAVWLKSEAGAADLVYPIAPAPRYLQIGRLYPVDEFLAAIRPAGVALVAAGNARSTP
jgi:hypothetical protein